MFISDCKLGDLERAIGMEFNSEALKTKSIIRKLGIAQRKCRIELDFL